LQEELGAAAVKTALALLRALRVREGLGTRQTALSAKKTRLRLQPLSCLCSLRMDTGTPLAVPMQRVIMCVAACAVVPLTHTTWSAPRPPPQSTGVA
jgi:hypothetical protein